MSKKILIFGCNGLLGSSVFYSLSDSKALNVVGTVRTEDSIKYFPFRYQSNIISSVDIANQESLEKIFVQTEPDIVINCVSLPSSLLRLQNPLEMIPIYSLLPHRLAEIANRKHTRLINISTDGVFSGNRGFYSELDFPDASDLYGRAKILGEISQSKHVITLRTSMFGHSIRGNNGLIDWFLSQQELCKGYTRVLFSGLPTVVIAEIIRDYIIPRPDIWGIYNLAAAPISKFNLLNLVKEIYNKKITITPDDEPYCDRSLNAARFCDAVGYEPPVWGELIKIMYHHRGKYV